jgi:hypothetical protein
MRAHVTQTIEDLKSTAAELTRMAQVLEVVFAENPSAPVPTPELVVAPTAPTPNPVPAVESTARRGRVSYRNRRATDDEPPPRDYSPKARPGAIHAVRCAIAEVPEPFSLFDVRSWMESYNPKVLAGMGKSSLSTAMFALRKSGLIREMDKKPGPRGPVSCYKRSPGFTAEPGPSMTEKERRYREQRSTIKTGEQEAAA